MVNVVFHIQFYVAPLATSLPSLSYLPKSFFTFSPPVFLCEGLDSSQYALTCKILEYVGRKHYIF